MNWILRIFHCMFAASKLQIPSSKLQGSSKSQPPIRLYLAGRMQSEKGRATVPVALFGVSPNSWCGRFHSPFGAPWRVQWARRRDADESGRDDRAPHLQVHRSGLARRNRNQAKEDFQYLKFAGPRICNPHGSPCRTGLLEFGVWNFTGAWCLVLGASSVSQRVESLRP